MRWFDWEVTTDPAVEVEYIYYKGDSGVAYYSDGSGQRPENSSVDVTRFIYKGTDITEVVFELVSLKILQDLEEQICDWEEDSGNDSDFLFYNDTL